MRFWTIIALLISAVLIQVLLQATPARAGDCGASPLGPPTAAWAREYAGWCSCMGGSFDFTQSGACTGTTHGDTEPEFQTDPQQDLIEQQRREREAKQREAERRRQEEIRKRKAREAARRAFELEKREL